MATETVPAESLRIKRGLRTNENAIYLSELVYLQYYSALHGE